MAPAVAALELANRGRNSPSRGGPVDASAVIIQSMTPTSTSNGRTCR